MQGPFGQAAAQTEATEIIELLMGNSWRGVSVDDGSPWFHNLAADYRGGCIHRRRCGRAHLGRRRPAVDCGRTSGGKVTRQRGVSPYGLYPPASLYFSRRRCFPDLANGGVGLAVAKACAGHAGVGCRAAPA